MFKEIVDGRTHARTHGRTTDDGRRTLKDHKSSLSTSCSGELKSNLSYDYESTKIEKIEQKINLKLVTDVTNTPTTFVTGMEAKSLCRKKSVPWSNFIKE